MAHFSSFWTQNFSSEMSNVQRPNNEQKVQMRLVLKRYLNIDSSQIQKPAIEHRFCGFSSQIKATGNERSSTELLNNRRKN